MGRPQHVVNGLRRFSEALPQSGSLRKNVGAVIPSEPTIQIRQRLQYAEPVLFLSHVLFALWIQAQDLWTSHSSATLWQAGVDMLWHQGQAILLGLLLALLWTLNVNRPRAQRAVVVVACALLFLLALDQLFYQLFTEHLRFHFSEETRVTDARAFWGSFKAAIGPFFLVNLALAAALSGWLWRRAAPAPSMPPLFDRRRTLWACALLALYLWGGSRTNDVSSRVENHPLLTLLQSIARPSSGAGSAARGSSGDIEALRWGKPSFDGASEAAVLSYAKQRGQGAAPNLILVTWESVGALNLLEKGAMDPALTPNLAAWSAHTVLFPTLTTGFPGTVRSHLLLTTGGHGITWGSEEGLIPQAWKGPSLGQILKKNGYSTGLFAASYFFLASKRGLYERQAWDKLQLPDDLSPAIQAKNRLNAWGLEDGWVLQQGLQWIREQPLSKPFFFEFMVSATHHPYSVPANFARRFSRPGESGTEAAHKDAIRYIDAQLGVLVEGLKAQGRLENTVIAIVGDHGEAFGRQHPGNLLHNHEVYEENLRSYLLLLDFQWQGGPTRSTKSAWMGDVMPSLLHLSHAKAAKRWPGQDLFDPAYQARIRYFHKNVHPEKWGLRDGDWKFIALKEGPQRAELYDLASDPSEQKNLAAEHPDRVEAYTQLCAQWYERTNRDYTDLMEVPPQGAEATDVQQPGPRLLQVGYRDEKSGFQALTQVHPSQRLSAYTHGQGYAQDTPFVYEWLSPSGYRDRVGLLHPANASETWLDYEPEQSLEPGTWELRLFQNERLVLRSNFKVSPSAALVGPPRAAQSGSLDSLSFGVRRSDGSVQAAPLFNPDEKLSAVVTGQAWAHTKALTFDWISPSGRLQRAAFNYGQGWKGAWVGKPMPNPLEEGVWKVNVYDRDRLLISGGFEVNARAPRLRP